MTRKSKGALQRMKERKGPHRLDEVIDTTVGDAGLRACPLGIIRYSAILRHLTPDAQAEAERERVVAAVCEKHGTLADPVMLISGEGSDMRAVYVCPRCSSPEILAQWEREGAN